MVGAIKNNRVRQEIIFDLNSPPCSTAIALVHAVGGERGFNDADADVLLPF
jgi:hypothetical protein